MNGSRNVDAPWNPSRAEWPDSGRWLRGLKKGEPLPNREVLRLIRKAKWLTRQPIKKRQ